MDDVKPKRPRSKPDLVAALCDAIKHLTAERASQSYAAQLVMLSLRLGSNTPLLDGVHSLCIPASYKSVRLQRLRSIGSARRARHIGIVPRATLAPLPQKKCECGVTSWRTASLAGGHLFVGRPQVAQRCAGADAGLGQRLSHYRGARSVR